MHDRDHGRERGALASGLVVSAGLCVAEVVGGYWTNSLALLSDSAHMLSDVGALALSLFGVWIAARPASASKTYGYYRAEILAALVNGVVLWVLVVFLAVEAWRRLADPPVVATGPMLVVAAFGLAVNIAVAMRLRPHSHGSLGVRGAYLHVVSDALGSVGVLASGGVMALTGWYAADAFASFAIAALILVGSWQLVREAVDVLMEAVPAHLDPVQVERTLGAIAGTAEVHDLHVWTITPGVVALSAHVVADGLRATDAMLADFAQACAREFGIDHVTIQIEAENRRASEPRH